ncbi:hypothetical protein BKA81DRAFT_364961 [Phyllosticta paracitricarpa]
MERTSTRVFTDQQPDLLTDRLTDRNHSQRRKRKVVRETGGTTGCWGRLVSREGTRTEKTDRRREGKEEVSRPDGGQGEMGIFNGALTGPGGRRRATGGRR